MEKTSAVEAVEALIRDYHKLVFHTIYALTNDWEESQDLTQDTFHQALRGIEAARSTRGAQFHPKAWLLRIALNTVRMQRRRRSLFSFIPFSRMQEGKQQDSTDREAVSERALPVQPAGYGSTSQQGDPADLIAEQDMVQQTLAKLPEEMRVCLLLSIIGGLSTAEIASMLEVNEATVRQRLSRARKRFQQLYTQESGEELVECTQDTQVLDYSDPRRKKKERSGRRLHDDQPQRLSLASHPSKSWGSYA